MSYRQIYIRKAEKLSLRHHSLIIKKESEEIAIPLEDIASLLLEDHQTVITAALLAALSDYYITLIICDEKHLPITQTLPMNMHYKQLKVFYDQLGVKKPFNSQLWNRLIHYKEKQHMFLKYNELLSERADFINYFFEKYNIDDVI